MKKVMTLLAIIISMSILMSFKYTEKDIRNVERVVYRKIITPVSKYVTSYLIKNNYNKRYNTTYEVHPLLDNKVKAMIKEAKSKGIDLRVVSSFRGFKEQAYLYSKGRTTKGGIVTNAVPGTSFHNYGWAVDVCEYKNGKPYWKSKRWKEIGAIGKKHGLVWGGDWTRLVDKPHFQLSINEILFKVIL